MAENIEYPLKHRDLDWLNFNYRVLQEAEDTSNPVYERLKFLAIFSSNLDEFFRVRVSQLRQIKQIDKSLRKRLALKPNKLVKQIITEVQEQQQKFGEIFNNSIIPELENNNIYIIENEKFNKEQLKEAQIFYQNEVAPLLQAQLVNLDKDKSIFLANNEIYFCIQFKEENKAGFVNIPVNELGRFYQFKNNKKHAITFLDDVVKMHLQELFPHKKIKGVFEIKISRDAELYLDEFSGELAEKIYESLEQRDKGQPTRLLYDGAIPKDFRKSIRKYLGIGKIDLVPGGKYHNFSDFFEFPNPYTNKLVFKKLPPIAHPAFQESKDLFETVKKKDRLLHFPYMSFDYVEDFIENAANDKDVTKIKISFYRVADESKLTSSLLKALENGIKVTVFIEAKARFDEENNINWGRKFEEKGAHVIYSYPKIKVHSKVFYIERKENDKKVRYAYIGTGNFNAETSKIYCDHGLFTADKRIAKDLGRVFKVLEGKLIIPKPKYLIISPFNTRKKFEKLILQEMENAKKGKKAKITVKINSLEDKDMIKLIYRAARKGVEVRMLVRGFTSLISGKENISENIYTTSIIDRFLEHGRLYKFYNNGKELMYFGSADWMSRNLDRRIEVLAPVLDKDIFKEFDDILKIQLSDNVKARVQDYNEKNQYVKPAQGKKKIRSQYEIYSYLKEKHRK